MKNKKTKIIIIIAVVLFFCIVSIKMPVAGKVVDSVTKKPIAGIKIERVIEITSVNIQGGSSFSTTIHSAKTGKNGFFFMPPEFVVRPLIFFVYISDQWLNVNMNDVGNQGENEKYHPIGSRPGGSFYVKRPQRSKFFYKNIKLAPKVESLSDCNYEKICVEQNSFAIALRTDNEQLCLNVDDYKEGWDRGGAFRCVQIFAIARGDESVCELKRKINDREQNLKYDMEKCFEMVEMSKQQFQPTGIKRKETQKDEICRLFNPEIKILCEELIKKYEGDGPQSYSALELEGYGEPNISKIDDERTVKEYAYGKFEGRDTYTLVYKVLQGSSIFPVGGYMRLHNKRAGITEEFDLCGKKAVLKYPPDNGTVPRIVEVLAYFDGKYFHEIQVLHSESERKLVKEGLKEGKAEELKNDAIMLAKLFCKK